MPRRQIHYKTVLIFSGLLKKNRKEYHYKEEQLHSLFPSWKPTSYGAVLLLSFRLEHDGVFLWMQKLKLQCPSQAFFKRIRWDKSR